MPDKQFTAQVSKTISRYNMLPDGCRIGVAVSGGRDSVVLFAVLRELAVRHGWTLTVLHLNHRLRGAESDADEQFVLGLARESGVDNCTTYVDLRHAGNLEERARHARRVFFAQARQKHQLDRIATGHSLSDQAETVMLRLLRGASSAGLQGILPVTREGVVRPLIELSRAQVQTFAEARGLTWREDRSNLETRFARNHLRHNLMPLLRHEWNAGIEQVLAHTAELSRDEEAYWIEQIHKVYPSAVVGRSPGVVILDTGSLLQHPTALRRRMIRRAIEEAKGDLLGVGFEHVEAVLRLLTQPSAATNVRGLEARVSFGKLRLGSTDWKQCDFQVKVAPPVHIKLREHEFVIAQEGYNGTQTQSVSLDLDRVGGTVEIRNWRPADAYQPAGYGGRKKLHDLFQEARVPYWERPGWPIMVMDDQIVWSCRFGPAAEFAAGPSTRTVLTIREVLRGE